MTMPTPAVNGFICPELEIWGGAEYTHNRVGDRYLDQMAFSGHDDRPQDYGLFSQLGLRRLRIGLLWERFEATGSWAWADERLQALKELAIEPIAGLMHHGSGPRHTSLVDPHMPAMLGAYAGAVAARYPHIEYYTPVNEPNTTARFSCLYGIWYPHLQSRNAYLRALLQQVKATVLSMRAIREVRSDAKLVQTDDLGRIGGTEPMRATWELLEERQWLSFDLLQGTVDRAHPLFAYLVSAGISEREIFWFAENACPASVLGLNYYLTSDRYLDHRVSKYPEIHLSAEGHFADVETVRIRQNGIEGFEKLTLRAWDRYHLPVAVTEVHMGGDVEEQIRWATAAWEGATRARAAGADCRAITFWALLGSFYWNKLVTSENGYYEPGAYDVRSGQPRETQLAEVIRQMAAGEEPSHHALSRPGWWHLPERIYYPEHRAGQAA